MLDERLSLACSLFQPCGLAADIGTDHARLPVALLHSGRCRRIFIASQPKTCHILTLFMLYNEVGQNFENKENYL